jgi:hypothetical protein
MTSFHASLVVACIVAVSFVGCASPPPGSSDAGASGPSAGPGPRFSAGGPDAREYGADAGYPIGDQSTYFSLPFLVGSQSHLDHVFEGRIVRRASTPSPLGRAAAEPVIRYEHDGQTLTLDDYLGRHPTTGLSHRAGRHDPPRALPVRAERSASLHVVVDGQDRHRDADRDRHRRGPHPVGRRSRGDLRTGPGGHRIWAHLDPASAADVLGVRFREEYTGDDDVSLLARDTFLRLGKGGVEAVKRFNERVAPAGTRFSYASVETQVLGFVLTSAVGRSASEYLEQKIWQPIGAEADATWLIDRSGQEATLCCLNAVLRDYARLGLLLATTATGVAGRSSPPPGSGTPRAATRTSVTCGPGLPRHFSGTATRRGSGPARPGGSRSSASAASRSSSTRKVAW